VLEHRDIFEEIVVLSWSGVEMGHQPPVELGEGVVFLDAPADFEARLLAVSPLAQVKLGAWGDELPLPRSAPRH
jgi:hypothetical protein